jgi:uncharacterized repeat protein (TIGR04138 family)
MIPPPADTLTIEELADKTGSYAPEAFYFVQQGLATTSEHIHRTVKDESASRHVTGQQLAQGLREVAVAQWGLMARTVLQRWGIYSTLDFGRIVYAMIDAGLLSKTDGDSLEDFRKVYDFRTAFEQAYDTQRREAASDCAAV